MKKLLVFTVLILIILSGCGPDNENKEESRQIFAMDTIMTLTAYGTQSEEAVDAAVAEIYRLEDLLSATDPESEVSQINGKAGEVTRVSREVSDLLESALEISSLTDGAFDITIAPVLKLWGFPSGEYRIPGPDELAEAMTCVGYEKVRTADEEVTLLPGMGIDLGGIAKGYTGDCVLNTLSQFGITSALINLGGNVQAVGTKPDGGLWNIAVRDPEEDGSIGILAVSDTAVITSGGYERYFEGGDGVRYHHIIDPGTGYPADSGLASVTIVCGRGVIGDSLSTALFVMGLDSAIDYWRTNGGFEAVFIMETGDIYITRGLGESFSLSSGYESRSLTVIDS